MPQDERGFNTSGKFHPGHRRSAKMTPDQVFEMRSKYAAGATQGSLAREYCISVGQVGRIVRGEQWNNFGTIETDQELEQKMLDVPPMTEEQMAASLALVAQGLSPAGKAELGIEPAPDPLEAILARAKPMSESLSLIRERQAADDADALARGAELLKGLKELKNSDSDSRNTGDSQK